MKTYPLHPIAEAFPDMSDDDYYPFEEDIAENGLRTPIAVWHEQVIDGRHRLKACLRRGVEPRYEFLDDDADPYKYVLSANVRRRQLNKSQVGLMVAEIGKHAQHGGDRRSADKAPSREEMAGDAGISRRTAQRGATVLEQGAPEVVDAVRQGRMTLTDAEGIIDREPEEQREAVQAVEEGKARTARAALPPPPPPPEDTSPEQAAPDPEPEPAAEPVASPLPPPPPAQETEAPFDEPYTVCGTIGKHECVGGEPEERVIAMLESEIRFLREQTEPDADRDAEFKRLREEARVLQTRLDACQQDGAKLLDELAHTKAKLKASDAEVARLRK